MTSQARASLCLVLLLGTGCSRALRFNCGVSSDDGGQAQHDAAAGQDLSAPVDMVKPIDQSISMSDLAKPDLAVGGDDLLSRPDLLLSSDLKKTMDLSNDLLLPDSYAGGLPYAAQRVLFGLLAAAGKLLGYRSTVPVNGQAQAATAP